MLLLTLGAVLSLGLAALWFLRWTGEVFLTTLTPPNPYDLQTEVESSDTHL